MEKIIHSVGNSKVGKDTVIINIHPSYDCPAKDICLLRNNCYAWSAERRHRYVMAYRKRQEEQWERLPASHYIDYLKKLKNGFLDYVRWQEAGDFAGQEDIDKMSEIAEALKGMYVNYTYSARYDLDFSKRSSNLIVTGTYFMVDNMFIPVDSDMYKWAKSNTKFIDCPGSCQGCMLCKTAGNKEIYIKKH